MSLQLSLLNSALVWAVSRLALPAPSAVVDSAGVDDDLLGDGVGALVVLPGAGLGEALGVGVGVPVVSLGATE